MSGGASAPQLLLVEDEALIAMQVEDMLEELGCRVSAQPGGVADALVAVAAGGFAAALLDLSLGGEAAWPVADALAERAIPFAFCSGSTDGVPPRHAAVPVLTKPYGSGQLRVVVDQLLGRS